MKVIFLDIDGVLNSVDWMKTIAPNSWKAGDGETQLDPAAVLRLDRVAKESGARIVISSTWRKIYRCGAIAGFLRRRGFTGEVIGETPDFSRLEPCERGTVDGRFERGHEIQAWLDEHPQVTHFAILDDDSDMAHLADHFVHTRHPSGLTDAHIPQLLKLLGVE